MTILKTARLCALAGLAATLGAASSAFASRMAEELAGVVTAPELGERINVDGVTYTVAPSAHMDEVLLGLNVGDQVRLLLNGPAADRNTQVLDVIVLSKKAVP
jgi:hypothetical protein